MPMQPLPHRYRVHAAGGAAGSVTVGGERLPDLATEAPPEFGGPGGAWSPEALLLAAVADCYVLSFRAAARAARLEWHTLSVDVEGLLERVDGITRFTRVGIAPRLGLPVPHDEAAALRVLETAKRLCLVTNSLNAECTLAPVIAGVPVLPA